jgi:hypothetical protein
MYDLTKKFSLRISFFFDSLIIDKYKIGGSNKNPILGASNLNCILHINKATAQKLLSIFLESYIGNFVSLISRNAYNNVLIILRLIIGLIRH